MDTLGKLVKLIPSIRLRSPVFKAVKADFSKGVAQVIFSPVKDGAYPPFVLRALSDGREFRDIAIGFLLPEKLPPNPANWASFYFLHQRDSTDTLARCVNDGEQWGLELNRFTRDGHDGPPDVFVADLAAAVKKAKASAGFTKKVKEQLVKSLLQVERLVERDAVGKFAFESVLPYSPSSSALQS